jgi:hypothetical protein
MIGTQALLVDIRTSSQTSFICFTCQLKSDRSLEIGSENLGNPPILEAFPDAGNRQIIAIPDLSFAEVTKI